MWSMNPLEVCASKLLMCFEDYSLGGEGAAAAADKQSCTHSHMLPCIPPPPPLHTREGRPGQLSSRRLVVVVVFQLGSLFSSLEAAAANTDLSSKESGGGGGGGGGMPSFWWRSGLVEGRGDLPLSLSLSNQDVSMKREEEEGFKGEEGVEEGSLEWETERSPFRDIAASKLANQPRGEPVALQVSGGGGGKSAMKEKGFLQPPPPPPSLHIG